MPIARGSFISCDMGWIRQGVRAQAGMMSSPACRCAPFSGSPNGNGKDERWVLSCSALLLVAAIALPLGNDGFGLAPPIGCERLAGTYLLVRELTLLIAP